MNDEEESLATLLKDLDYKTLIFYQILRCCKVSDDPFKFVVAVNVLESMLSNELEEKYYEEVKKAEKEITEKIPIEKSGERALNLALAKFRLLMFYVQRRIPKEEEGVLE